MPTIPRSFLQLWHLGGPCGIWEPELWSVVARGQVGLSPLAPPGARGAGVVPPGEVRGHAQQPALPPGQDLSLEWTWAGQAVFRASLGCSSEEQGGNMSPALWALWVCSQLPWLCACHVAGVELLETTWDGQEPPWPLKPREGCPRKDTSTLSCRAVSPWLQVLPSLFRAGFKSVFYCKMSHSYRKPVSETGCSHTHHRERTST